MTTVHESNSPKMEELLQVSNQISRTRTALLLQGETGTGKEWLAHRIHAASAFSEGPFIAVNCAGIPDGLVEATLFGHTKGAFTGAVRSARGHFEMAQGGTIFLDEIGEVSPAVQVKLLRVLQDHTFQPVGSERSMEVDCRVIAATNRDLSEAVEQGTLRRDLYYRLAVITLELPPLRERIEDIPGLVEDFVERIAHREGRSPPRISGSAMEALKQHTWEGNVRELINVLERSVLLCTSNILLPEHLRWSKRALSRDTPGLATDSTQEPSATLNGAHADEDPGSVNFKAGRAAALYQFEDLYLKNLLQSTNGRIRDAVEVSGIRTRTLYTLLRKHGLRKEDFKG